MTVKKERNSSYELLRLLCIYGIVVMHASAGAVGAESALNREFHILCNSLFNVGVTCFILISGYFGIRFSLQKLVRMELMTVLFSVISTLLSGEFGIRELLKSCLPVLTRRYWFISCYFALFVLAPFLNEAAGRMERARFRQLLLALLLIFSFVPTLTGYDVMQDAGKGLADFVMVYLIGRYLALYHKRPHEKKRLAAGFVCCILAIFALDSARTIISGELYSSFSRDCSALIILAAVLLLLLFGEMRIKSAAINRLAGSVLAVTVLDGGIQSFLRRQLFDPCSFAGGALFPPLLLGYSALVVAIGILLNELRKLLFGWAEPAICSFAERAWNWLCARATSIMDKILSRLI